MQAEMIRKKSKLVQSRGLEKAKPIVGNSCMPVVSHPLEGRFPVEFVEKLQVRPLAD